MDSFPISQLKIDELKSKILPTIRSGRSCVGHVIDAYERVAIVLFYAGNYRLI
jgi:hypothetical protein